MSVHFLTGISLRLGYYCLQYICFRDFFGIFAANFGIYPLGQGIKGLTKCTANEFVQSLFQDCFLVIFSVVRKICYIQYTNYKKNKCCKVIWWWSGSAYIVVDGSVPLPNFYFSSCRMYELI
jgi:hypothetical protein